MIAEIFITPEVFESCDAELRTQLNELAATLLPNRNTPRFVVCQLDARQWLNAVTKKIASIKNLELRSNAMAMFLHLINKEHDICVERPIHERAACDSEKEWVLAAKRSSQISLIDGIITTASMAVENGCMDVKTFCSTEFWNRFPNPRRIERDLPAQEPLLRTICLHSDWLLIRLPYIGGDDGDEVTTLKQILQLATKRMHGQTKCTVEVQVASRPKRKGGDDTLKNDVTNQIANYQSQLESLTVRIVSADSILERMLFAGEWAPMPNEQRARRVRWLLTMSHVAIGKNRRQSVDPSTWSLFDRKTAHHQLKQLEQSTLRSE